MPFDCVEAITTTSRGRRVGGRTRPGKLARHGPVCWIGTFVNTSRTKLFARDRGARLFSACPLGQKVGLDETVAN
eukprot:6634295-Prymnesium_polylepis.1